MMAEGRIDVRKLHLAFPLLLAVAVSILFFRMIQDFVVTVLLAAIFAGLAYPFYTRVVGWLGGRRPLAALVTVVVLLLCLFIPVLLFLGLVAKEAVSVSESAVPWIERHLQDPGATDQLFEKLPFSEHLAPYKQKILETSGAIAQHAAHLVGGAVASATAVTARFALLLFVFLYAKFQFLLGGPALPQRILHFVPLSKEERHRLLSTFTSVTRATVIGAAVIGLIQGGLAGIAFAIAGIHGALLWTAIMVVMSIIPGIGATIIWVPAVIYLAVEGRFGAAIALGLWCALVVGSVDNLLRPRLVGKETQLPNLLVLLGTLGGLFFFGPVGFILGPVVAALFVAVWQLFASRIEEIEHSPKESPAA